MKLLVNYANQFFTEQQKLNRKTGKTKGLFDEVVSYSPEDIDTDFYRKNKNILIQKRGNGFWLWKPYFIKRTLETLKQGDFLFYCDSGSYFIASISPLIELCVSTRQDIIVFDLPYREKSYTKRDAFILMDCDNAQFADSRQRLGGFSLWRKSAYAMDFVNELLEYSQDKRIITELENQCGYPNYKGFKEHRHDQSILSLLSKKHGLHAYRDPSQKGNIDKHFYKSSKYKQLIQLTGEKGYSFPRKVLFRLALLKKECF